MSRNVAITSDCTCDLGTDMLRHYGIEIISFYIHTDTGCFRDGEEITAVNVFECMENGGTTQSVAPKADDYVKFFRRRLKTCDEIIHITISSGISDSYENGMRALGMMEEHEAERIHIFDSKHLSTGTGHMVVRAAELSAAGVQCSEILSKLEKISSRVSTSFIAMNAEYLYENGKVSEFLRNVCRTFGIHPVLTMKDAKMSIKRIFFGNYEKAQKKYIRSELSKNKEIESNLLFVTHAGCTVKELTAIKKEIEKYGDFESVCVTNASATISSNCGPHTIGVLYVNK